MSLVKSKAIQLGFDATPTNNFLIYQPLTPDGTFRIANGNQGATTDIMTVTSGGSVTFAGTTNFSSLNFGAGSQSAPSLFPTGDSNTGIWFPAADTFAVSTGGTERLRIDTSGNIGLGSTLTNTNNKTLIRKDSVNNVTNVLMLNNGTADNQAGTGVRLLMSGVGESNANIRYSYIEAATATVGNDHYLAFGTNSSGTTPVERMRIDGSGNVIVASTSSNFTSYGAKLAVDYSTNGITALAVSNQNVGSGASAGIELGSSGNSWLFAVGSNAKNANALTWSADVSNPTERMRLDTSGNLSIGTTTSVGKLTVSGSIIASWQDTRIGTVYDNNYRQGMNFVTATRNLNIFSTSSDSGGTITFSTRLATGASDTDYGTERMRIDNVGNVGIGSAPVARFSVYKDFGANDAGAIAYFSDSNNAFSIHPRLTGGAYNSITEPGDWGIFSRQIATPSLDYGLIVGKHNGAAIRFGNNASADIKFANAGGETMRITAAGSVSIGAGSSPGAKLHNVGSFATGSSDVNLAYQIIYIGSIATGSTYTLPGSTRLAGQLWYTYGNNSGRTAYRVFAFAKAPGATNNGFGVEMNHITSGGSGDLPVSFNPSTGVFTWTDSGSTSNGNAYILIIRGQ